LTINYNFHDDSRLCIRIIKPDFLPFIFEKTLKYAVLRLYLPGEVKAFHNSVQ